MEADVHVLRGIVLSADLAEKLTDAAYAAGGEDGFDDVLDPAGDTLTFMTPLWQGGDIATGDGTRVVVVGAEVGRRSTYSFAVIKVDSDPPTLIDNGTGEPKELLTPQVSDAEIVAALNACGIVCTSDDLGTYVATVVEI